MFSKMKAFGLSLVLATSLILTAAIFLSPAMGQGPLECVPLCDAGPCICPAGEQCVVWVFPNGGPCIGPGGNCNDVCIGP